MERTFIAVKPDGVQRGLCGEIIKRFEQRGFRLVAAKFVQVTMATDSWRMHKFRPKSEPRVKKKSSVVLTAGERILPAVHPAVYSLNHTNSALKHK